jgi:hypothetical protein
MGRAIVKNTEEHPDLSIPSPLASHMWFGSTGLVLRGAFPQSDRALFSWESQELEGVFVISMIATNNVQCNDSIPKILRL